MTAMLAGTSPSRCSVREGVTVTASKMAAGDSTMSSSATPFSSCRFSAKPPARTTTVACPSGVLSNVNRPSGPVTGCCSAPELVCTMTDAPGTAPPLVSLTLPVMAGLACDNARRSANSIISLRF
jgi:hypothetical protein